MIGQKKIINHFKDIELSNCILLIGEEHSGKKTLAKELAKMKNLLYIISGKSVDELRDIIKTSYQNKIDSIYILPEIDKMSLNAKNSILKVIEEPPKHAKFILTANSAWQILPTIISRSDVFRMEKYDNKQLIQYLKKKEINKKDYGTICSICETPGQIDLLLKYDYNNLYNFCSKVVECIKFANLANAFKLLNELQFKEEDTGKYDINLFLNIVNHFSLIKIMDTEEEKFLNYIQITNKCKRAIGITGANKKHCLENWVIEMNEVE